MTRTELKPFRQRILSLWQEKADTVDMAKTLQVKEHECERALHVVLERRRAINKSLRA
ncbi:MAG: hypothetical protein KGL39_20135 [Patescibacteria group bacterium]|nr:hypothetical protein [Patescibacteria group bacterium]